MARLAHLSLFVPRFLHGDRKSLFAVLSRRDKALLANIMITAFVFALNLATVIFIVIFKGGTHNLGDLYTRDCDKMKLINTLIHLIINALSTVVLEASSSCAQLLIAPTRTEVTRAHKNGEWVDIGAPSIRNLLKGYIPMKRKFLWMLLVCTSIPLHLLLVMLHVPSILIMSLLTNVSWNSVFFSTIPVDDYLVAHVTKDYEADQGPWNYTISSVHYHKGMVQEEPLPRGRYNRNLHTMLRTGALERLDKRECMERYLDTTIRHKDVVIVSANTSMSDGDSLDMEHPHSSLIDVYQNIKSGAKWMWRVNWLCSQFKRYVRDGDALKTENPKAWCTPDFLLPKMESWAVRSVYMNAAQFVLREATIHVDYCLSAGVDNSRGGCAIRYSLVLLTVVTLANFIKLLCMCAVWFIHRRHQDAVVAGNWGQQPLVTLGDAMSSFLSHADETTSGYALLEREDCANGALRATTEKSLDRAESRMNRLRLHKLFFQGASKTQWLFVIIS